MVELKEVEDEAFTGKEGMADDEEGDWDTDNESDLSSVSDASDTPEAETLYERVAALRDILPPKQRAQLSSVVSTTTDWSTWSFKKAASAAWIVSVSVLLLVVPFGISAMEESTIMEEDRQYKMAQSQNEIMNPGAQSAQPGQQQKPAP